MTYNNSLLDKFLFVIVTNSCIYNKLTFMSFTLSKHLLKPLEKSSHIFNNIKSMLSNRRILMSRRASFLNYVCGHAKQS